MGSHMKRSIFDEQTNQALKKWHRAVRKRHKKESPSRFSTQSARSTPLTSHSSSPTPLLHRYLDSGYSDMIQNRESESPVRKKVTSNLTKTDNLNTEIHSSRFINLMPEFKHSVVENTAAELSQNVEEEDRDEEISFVKPPTNSKDKSQDLS